MIGRYLQPTHRHYPVAEYVTSQQFATCKIIGLEKGPSIVESAPLVRLPYHTEKHIRQKTRHTHYLLYRQSQQMNIRMDHKGTLSSVFNMSLGFTPVIISILLCEFTTQDTAIYIDTGIGIVGIYLLLYHKGVLIPNFILYIVTGMLALLSLAALIPGDYVPSGVPFLTLEVSILIPVLMLYIHKERFINHFLGQIGSCNKRLYAQGAEAAVVSVRFTLIFGILHFIIINIVVTSQDPLSQTNMVILYRVFPPIVFMMSILFNQIAIRYFNHPMSCTEYVPIVNMEGDVIRRSLAIKTLNYKNAYTNPVIRIAVSTHGMLSPCDKPVNAILNRGKTDISMKCYLHYGESLIEGVNRSMHSVPPHAAEDFKPGFNTVYHFENEIANWPIYFFIVDIKDDPILCAPRFKNSRLWNFKQIEENMNEGFFSSCFEGGYEHLKNVICIREKCREPQTIREYALSSLSSCGFI